MSNLIKFEEEKLEFISRTYTTADNLFVININEKNFFITLNHIHNLLYFNNKNYSQDYENFQPIYNDIKDYFLEYFNILNISTKDRSYYNSYAQRIKVKQKPDFQAIKFIIEDFYDSYNFENDVFKLDYTFKEAQVRALYNEIFVINKTDSDTYQTCSIAVDHKLYSKFKSNTNHFYNLSVYYQNNKSIEYNLNKYFEEKSKLLEKSGINN